MNGIIIIILITHIEIDIVVFMGGRCSVLDGTSIIIIISTTQISNHLCDILIICSIRDYT